MKFETGYYGVYDSRTNRFLMGIQQPSPAKARHKLKCRVSEDIIAQKEDWMVAPISDIHAHMFTGRLLWKSTNYHYKQQCIREMVFR